MKERDGYSTEAAGAREGAATLARVPPRAARRLARVVWNRAEAESELLGCRGAGR